MEIHSPILVADNDFSVRQVTSGLLALSGYDVKMAGDGEDAWRILRSQPCRLLVANHNMPTISGLQLVRLARTLAAALPVVVMNGGMTMDEMRMYHTFPAITILPKPFSGDQLLAAVHKLLNGADVSMLNNWTGKTVHSESAKA